MGYESIKSDSLKENKAEPPQADDISEFGEGDVTKSMVYGNQGQNQGQHKRT